MPKTYGKALRATRMHAVRGRRDTLLIELGQRVASRDSGSDLLAWAVRRVARVFDAPDCSIAELLPQANSLLLQAGSGSCAAMAGTLVPLSADSHAAQALELGRPLAQGAVAGEGSEVVVLLLDAGQPFGVLRIRAARRPVFTPADMRFLQSVADTLAGALAQKLRLREFESTSVLSHTLRQAAERPELVRMILSHLRSLTVCAGTAIVMRLPDGALQIGLGEGIWAGAAGAALVDGGGLTALVVADGQPLLRYAPDLPTALVPGTGARVRSMACFPLATAGGVIGALWVASAAVLSHGDLHVLRSVADIAASALRRLDLFDRTERLYREHKQLGEDVRRAERQLASIVESASDLVVSVDTSGHISSWNRAAERISGFSRAQVLGCHIRKYCPPRHWQMMHDMLQQFVASPYAGQLDELPLVDVDGQEIPISWRFAALQSDQGDLTGIVAVGRNLLEQRRLEVQLFQAAKMASMGVMAAGIGHELRNPLAIISANAQLAQGRLADTDLVATCLQQIHNATKRASAIIDNLLTFARPQSSGGRPVNLNEVLAATFAMLDYQIRQRGVTRTTSLTPSLPAVAGNAALLQQVLTNLILNACQAMPDGGELAVTTRKGDAGMVEVCVSDQGCGISADTLPKIFDPFFTTRPVGKGTGLGLAVSYNIVQQHGGMIDVISQPGAGSTFIVRLPALHG